MVRGMAAVHRFQSCLRLRYSGGDRVDSVTTTLAPSGGGISRVAAWLSSSRSGASAQGTEDGRPSRQRPSPPTRFSIDHKFVSGNLTPHCRTVCRSPSHSAPISGVRWPPGEKTQRSALRGGGRPLASIELQGPEA
jgi:hypothetical protein